MVSNLCFASVNFSFLFPSSKKQYPIIYMMQGSKADLFPNIKGRRNLLWHTFIKKLFPDSTLFLSQVQYPDWQFFYLCLDFLQAFLSYRFFVIHYMPLRLHSFKARSHAFHPWILTAMMYFFTV